MKTIPTILALTAITIPTIVLADGMTDYKAYCAGCHGANANIQTEKAKALKMDVKKLSLRASKMTKTEMIEIVENGK
jgi:mono/diheme cytochrome c family protein